MAVVSIILSFIISLVVSAIIIYLATKLFGETEGFGTAVMASFAGAVIFALTTYFLGTWWIAAIVGGVVWLIALGSLYKIGWVKSFLVAVVVWVFANVVGLVLPTIAGPL